MLPGIQHKGPGIGNGFPDGYVFRVFILIYLVVAGADRKFSRSVPVDYLHVTFLYRNHFFTTHDDVPQGQFKLVDQFKSKLGAEGSPGDVVVHGILVQFHHILAYVFGQDMYRCSPRQRAKQIVNRSVKAETGMTDIGILRGDLQIVHLPVNFGRQREVTDHYALGFPG